MALILVPTVIGLLATLLPTPQATIYLVASLIVEAIFVVVLWLALRPRGADVRSRTELERAIRGGKPVIVELFSSFCLICMSIRQASQTAADILKGQATVVRVELRTPGGREIGDAYGVSYVPSYLVFDEHGDLVRKIVPDSVTPLANGYRVLDDRGQVVRRLVAIEPGSLVDIARKA